MAARLRGDRVRRPEPVHLLRSSRAGSVRCDGQPHRHPSRLASNASRRGHFPTGSIMCPAAIRRLAIHRFGQAGPPDASDRRCAWHHSLNVNCRTLPAKPASATSAAPLVLPPGFPHLIPPAQSPAHLRDVPRRSRLAEQIPLRLGAMHRRQLAQLFRGLHAFRRGRHPQRRAQIDHCRNDRRAVVVGAETPMNVRSIFTLVNGNRRR